MSPDPALLRPHPAGLGLPKSPTARRGLYSWTIVEALGDPPALGAVGVCDDRERAMQEMADALRATSQEGAFGLLHKVERRLVGIGYWYSDLLALAHIDPDRDALVVSEGEPSGSRKPLSDVFCEVVRATGTPPLGNAA
ncbi:hypothetical protein [Thermomonospora cellulosilytica]|uniref:Uncharacterized protein n=1 Tax=Thermomonospora cellulosilytica TaxID=1411118 RepID=A0A7W3N4B1_9ACTN|nr:hypothetical protein [Thermomonospora cellulosilytica]MBA9007255.1 hypothetical protein [Thermomonospora cellulosilytica]